jgi:hippurate hydrolase
MVTRRTNVFDPVVLTCGKIAGGTTSNVIPETVEMLGTLRTTSEAARENAHQGIQRVASDIAAAHLCDAQVEIRRGYPVTVNDSGFVDFARGVATELVGPENYINMPAPFMGAEDFSYVLQRMPGCMMFLGVMPEGHDDPDHVASCHSNRMILNADFSRKARRADNRCTLSCPAIRQSFVAHIGAALGEAEVCWLGSHTRAAPAQRSQPI